MMKNNEIFDEVSLISDNSLVGLNKPCNQNCVIFANLRESSIKGKLFCRNIKGILSLWRALQ